jgi:hypothetical protein
MSVQDFISETNDGQFWQSKIVWGTKEENLSLNISSYNCSKMTIFIEQIRFMTPIVT